MVPQARTPSLTLFASTSDKASWLSGSTVFFTHLYFFFLLETSRGVLVFGLSRNRFFINLFRFPTRKSRGTNSLNIILYLTSFFKKSISHSRKLVSRIAVFSPVDYPLISHAISAVSIPDQYTPSHQHATPTHSPPPPSLHLPTTKCPSFPSFYSSLPLSHTPSPSPNLKTQQPTQQQPQSTNLSPIPLPTLHPHPHPPPPPHTSIPTPPSPSQMKQRPSISATYVCSFALRRCR